MSMRFVKVSRIITGRIVVEIGTEIHEHELRGTVRSGIKKGAVMAQDIPVYLFTGFMDSGKTSLVEETLFKTNLAMEPKALSLCVKMVKKNTTRQNLPPSISN